MAERRDPKTGDEMVQMRRSRNRALLAAIAGLAVVLTLSVESSIFARVLFAWAALGAAFGPIVVIRVLGYEPAGWAILSAMLSGFALTVVFNLIGQIPAGEVSGGLMQVLHGWAVLPGDPFERLVPWLPALGLLWAGRGQGRGTG